MVSVMGMQSYIPWAANWSQWNSLGKFYTFNRIIGRVLHTYNCQIPESKGRSWNEDVQDDFSNSICRILRNIFDQIDWTLGSLLVSYSSFCHLLFQSFLCHHYYLRILRTHNSTATFGCFWAILWNQQNNPFQES